MRYTTRENRHVLALGNQVLYGDRIVSVIYCGALALEEFELASYLPFLMNSGPDWIKMVDPVEEQRAAPRRMLPALKQLILSRADAPPVIWLTSHVAGAGVCSARLAVWLIALRSLTII